MVQVLVLRFWLSFHTESDRVSSLLTAHQHKLSEEYEHLMCPGVTLGSRTYDQVLQEVVGSTPGPVDSPSSG